MIYYDLGDTVQASSTCIGEELNLSDIITPEYQAHSTNVAVIPDDVASTHGVDALITDKAWTRIGVRTADCVPILIHDYRSHAIAAIHSGWKGTANNITGNVIAKMHDLFGSEPCNMKAVIGPCIHIDAFEIGNEVYEIFNSLGYSDYAKFMINPYNAKNEMKWHIDLAGICMTQLTELGVHDIYTSPYCTYKNHEMLYSYRYSKSPDPSHRIITSIMMTDI